MGKVGGQKLKILRIYQILMEQSDEAHPMNTSEIVEALKEYEISAERKTIYTDMEILMDADIDVVKTTKGYYIGNRSFQLPELKLLADAVSASKFISAKKAKALLKKLEGLASKSEAKQLSRQVVVPDRVKQENEKVLYTIDTIYQSIDEDRMLSFQYSEWNIKKERVLRRNGMRYLVSPAFLIRNDENYYVVAFDENDKKIKHYRVDKIVDARVENESRDGGEALAILNPDEYAKHNVSMFSGETTIVTVKCNRNLAGVIIDKFGTEISMREDGDEFLKARIPVAVSAQFFGWVTGIKGTIIAPESAANAYKCYLEDILKL